MNKIISIAILLAAFGSEHLLACSCNMGSAKKKFKSSFSVFAGKVSEVEHLGTANAYGDENTIVHFVDVVTLKGDATDVLHTADNGAGCTGYWFKEKLEYLVYTFKRNDGHLDTMWCGGVISSSKNKKEFAKELNKVKRLAK